MKDQKRLKVGTKDMPGRGLYSGTLDDQGNAFGEGQVGNYKGTFMNNERHGFCKCIQFF